MINRLKAGYVLVRNPMFNSLVYRIDLDPKSVGCLYFMTKDPTSMIQYIDEILEMGHNMIFQVTVNPYGRSIEPNVPDKSLIVEAFKEISKKIGKERTIWRYDPVIFDERHNMLYHERKFRLLCSELSEYTERCVFSFLDMYPKFDKLKSSPPLTSSSTIQREEFMRMIGNIAIEYGIKLSYCCASNDYQQYGIDNRGCIDRETMISLNIPFEDVPGNIREGCKCVKNIDIGAYDTCTHNCVYCYANNISPEKRSSKTYDPDSEMLYGSLQDSDTVKELTDRRLRITDF